MSNVLALDRLAAESELPSHRRLRLLSRGLALLFTGLLALLALYLVAMVIVLFFFSDHLLVSSDGVLVSTVVPHARAGMVRLSDQPFITHLAGVADEAIASAPIFFVFLHLRGLFRLYAAGIVFARDNALHLKRIGLWLIAYPFFKFASNMVFRAAGGTDHAWFHALAVQTFILGLIVTVIAQVMEFGREIEQEKDSFI